MGYITVRSEFVNGVEHMTTLNVSNTLREAQNFLVKISNKYNAPIEYEPTDYEKAGGNPFGGIPAVWQYVVRVGNVEYKNYED